MARILDHRTAGSEPSCHTLSYRPTSEASGRGLDYGEIIMGGAIHGYAVKCVSRER